MNEIHLFNTSNNTKKVYFLEARMTHTFRISLYQSSLHCAYIPPRPPPPLKMSPQLSCCFAECEPCRNNSLLLKVGIHLGSSLALDLRSHGACMCCRNALASTSNGGMVVGDAAFRLLLPSLSRTIVDKGGQCRSVQQRMSRMKQMRWRCMWPYNVRH